MERKIEDGKKNEKNGSGASTSGRVPALTIERKEDDISPGSGAAKKNTYIVDCRVMQKTRREE